MRGVAAGLLLTTVLGGCLGFYADDERELVWMEFAPLQANMYAEWDVAIDGGHSGRMSMDLHPAEVLHRDGAWRPGYVAEFTQDPTCELYGQPEEVQECWDDDEPEGYSLRSESLMGRPFPQTYGLDACGNPLWTYDEDGFWDDSLVFDFHSTDNVPPWFLDLAGRRLPDDPSTTMRIGRGGGYAFDEGLYLPDDPFLAHFVLGNGPTEVYVELRTEDPRSFETSGGYSYERVEADYAGGTLPAQMLYDGHGTQQTIDLVSIEADGEPIARCAPREDTPTLLPIDRLWSAIEPDLPFSLQAALAALQDGSTLPLSSAMLARPSAFVASWQGTWMPTRTPVATVPDQDVYQWTFKVREDQQVGGVDVACEHRNLPAPLDFACWEVSVTENNAWTMPTWGNLTMRDVDELAALATEATGHPFDYASYYWTEDGHLVYGDVGHAEFTCNGICFLETWHVSLLEPRHHLNWVEGAHQPWR